jgi:ryanodine receptor 2
MTFSNISRFPVKIVNIALFLYSIVVYEGGDVVQQARSLWRLELARTKWAGGFINWFHPMRIRHITTGRYLGVNEAHELCLLTK